MDLGSENDVSDNVRTNTGLNRLADMVFIVGVVVVLGFGGWQYFTNRPEHISPSPAARIEQNRIGTVLPRWQFLGSARSSNVVLIFVRSQCHFCTASMPFYRQLASLARSVGTRFIVLSPEPIPVTVKYLSEQGLSVDDVEQVQTSVSFAISGTPTLIVADRTDHVLGSWLGRL